MTERTAADLEAAWLWDEGDLVLEPVLASTFHKRGTHDQSSHGSWSSARRFTSTDEMHDWINEQRARQPRTEEQVTATIEYQTGGWRGINEGRRRGYMDTNAQATTAAGLDSALAEAPPLTEDIMAFRGVGEPYEQWIADGTIAAGSTFTDKAFVSTSIDPRIPMGGYTGKGSGAFMELELPKGTKGLALREQREFLLGESTFEIVGIEEVDPGEFGYRYKVQARLTNG